MIELPTNILNQIPVVNDITISNRPEIVFDSECLSV